MPADRWWRGYDAVILAEVAAGSRILDVGCGDGGLVEGLEAGGLDAVGVDPRAPAGDPRLVAGRVEELRSLGRFDAVCAFMSLHHADLEAVVAALARLLQPRGRLFVCDFAWEAYDERAAAWVAARDPSDADNSVDAWRHEHRELHRGAIICEALSSTFDLRSETHTAYLARMIGMRELKREEEAMIAADGLPALGRWYLATPR